MITNASREAARAAIVVTITPESVSDEKIKEVVNKYAEAHLITFGNKIFDPPTITPSWTDRDTAPFGTDLTVVLSFNYDFLVLSAFGFGPINMRARTVMKME